MYRASATGGSPFAAVLLVVVLVLSVTGCDVSDHKDLVPTFEQSSIPDKSYVQNRAIDSETLPAATGGDGTLTYTISPHLPAGLAFEPATRLLSGTPTTAQPATLYTYTATDSDTVDPDSASLTFSITVRDLMPTFEQASIPDKSYDRDLPIDSETLPAATGGDGALTYAISPHLPAGLIFDPATRLLSGTPTTAQPATLYTYTATDSDAVDPDSASLTFRVTVEAVASVSISAGVEEVDEGDDRTPVAVTLTLSEAVTGEVAIALAPTGTARLGSDFDLASTEVTVVEGSTQATTTITPIRDLEAEYDEIITLKIDSVAGRGEIGAPSSVRIVIRDLGAPPPNEYAVLDAYMLLWGGETYDIDTDAPLPVLYCQEHRPRRRISHPGHPVNHDGLVLRHRPFPSARRPVGACPGADWTVF